mmetsp:Transcript_24563/g.57058  ORF Transcript_24563/g.57058 Transcript_24563/m.57058 type:complete len:267 (-) Transcript_24563:384-1184(-)
MCHVKRWPNQLQGCHSLRTCGQLEQRREQRMTSCRHLSAQASAPCCSIPQPRSAAGPPLPCLSAFSFPTRAPPLATWPVLFAMTPVQRSVPALPSRSNHRYPARAPWLALSWESERRSTRLQPPLAVSPGVCTWRSAASSLLAAFPAAAANAPSAGRNASSQRPRWSERIPCRRRREASHLRDPAACRNSQQCLPRTHSLFRAACSSTPSPRARRRAVSPRADLSAYSPPQGGESVDPSPLAVATFGRQRMPSFRAPPQSAFAGLH